MVASGVVARAAIGFGVDPERLRPLGGASRAAWSDGHVVLRVGGRVADEVPALAAAAGHLPVPRVLGRLDLPDASAVLLERVAGRPAGELALSSPAGGSGRPSLRGAARRPGRSSVPARAERRARRGRPRAALAAFGPAPVQRPRG